MAEEKVRDTFRRFDPNAEVEVLSANSVKVKADRQYIPSIIGRGGSTISDLEKMLNVHIDVVERDSLESSPSSFELPFDFSESRTSLLFNVGKENSGKYADIFIQDKYLSTSRIGRKGQIKIPRKSSHAKELMRNASSQNDIQIFLKD